MVNQLYTPILTEAEKWVKYTYMFSHIDGRLSHSKIFHSIGDVTIVGEGLQILTYARHLWQLSSKGSLACHTFCDTGHLIIMVKSEDPSQLRLMPSV